MRLIAGGDGDGVIVIIIIVTIITIIGSGVGGIGVVVGETQVLMQHSAYIAATCWFANQTIGTSMKNSISYIQS